MMTSGDDASSFLSRRQIKESDSRVCQALECQRTMRRSWQIAIGRNGAYACVECDGPRVDAQAAELEQLLELNWQGRRHCELDALGCADQRRMAANLSKVAVLQVERRKLGIVTLKGGGNSVELGRDSRRDDGGARIKRYPQPARSRNGSIRGTKRCSDEKGRWLRRRGAWDASLLPARS